LACNGKTCHMFEMPKTKAAFTKINIINSLNGLAIFSAKTRLHLEPNPTDFIQNGPWMKKLCLLKVPAFFSWAIFYFIFLRAPSDRWWPFWRPFLYELAPSPGALFLVLICRCGVLCFVIFLRLGPSLNACSLTFSSLLGWRRMCNLRFRVSHFSIAFFGCT
jgi:hypothetical protein